MTRQNRVTPYGEIIRTAARGTFMGNRGGCLHDDAGNLTTARWKGTRWIVCVLEFRGRRRTIMTPSRYTELFFLDEATAFAAGHRPCAECRWQPFNRFKQAWLQGNASLGLGAAVRVEQIDGQLHRDRLDAARRQATFTARLDSLPDGVFVTLPESPAAALLLWQQQLHRWSAGGYTAHIASHPNLTVRVLTPRSTVNAITAGYVPSVHTTAMG